MENQVLNKMVDSFEDFKERLIRIEENVKDIKNVKTDVENIKIQMASLESKAASAHKRLDSMEGGQTWMWRTVIGGFILGAIGLIFKFKGGI